jgi:hypothetical protein
MIDLSEEEQNFIEIISASEEKIAFLGNAANTSVTAIIYDNTDLESKSSRSEQSDSLWKKYHIFCYLLHFNFHLIYNMQDT